MSKKKTPKVGVFWDVFFVFNFFVGRPEELGDVVVFLVVLKSRWVDSTFFSTAIYERSNQTSGVDQKFDWPNIYYICDGDLFKGK